MKYEVGIVDDHRLFLKSLSLMMESFERFTVTLEAINGAELQAFIKVLSKPPDILLLDVNMPGMDGIETATWLSEHYPIIKLAALSMNDTDKAILGMIKAGCCSYLLKNTHPNELEIALLQIAEKGYYNASSSNINFQRLIKADKKQTGISEREKHFLPYACSDLTYKQIAAILGVTERTVDGYRESLFAKLNVQSRTGLAMEAVRRGLVDL